jgi:hypothetical protein
MKFNNNIYADLEKPHELRNSTGAWHNMRLFIYIEVKKKILKITFIRM